MTTCITSQAIIAMHFMYTAFRSRNGRAWAYAPLRFEYDQLGKALLSDMSLQELKQLENEYGRTELSRLSVLQMRRTADKRRSTVIQSLPASHKAATACNSLQSAIAVVRNILDQRYSRWLQYQQTRIASCRLFVRQALSLVFLL
jgi:hypothetical protein